MKKILLIWITVLTVIVLLLFVDSIKRDTEYLRDVEAINANFTTIYNNDSVITNELNELIKVHNKLLKSYNTSIDNIANQFNNPDRRIWVEIK